MTTISNPAAIRCLQLRTQLQALKLESCGLRRRGRSMSAMLKDVYGLPSRAPLDAVIQAVREDLANAEEMLTQEVQK